MRILLYARIFTTHHRLLRWFAVMDVAYCSVGIPSAVLLPARDLQGMVSTIFGLMLLWIASVIYHAMGYERHFSSFRYYLALPFERWTFFVTSLLLPLTPFVVIFVTVALAVGGLACVIPGCSVNGESVWWVFAFGVFVKTTSLPLLLLSRRHPLFVLLYIAALGIAGLVTSIIHEIFLPWVPYPLPVMSAVYLAMVLALSVRVVRGAW